MANSFLKSLPSHKKKRKLRHRERRAGSSSQTDHDASQKSHGETAESKSTHDADSNQLQIEEHEPSDQSLLSDTESCVPGTEFQYPIAAVDKSKYIEKDDETIGMYSPLSGRAPVLDGGECSLKSAAEMEGKNDGLRGVVAVGDKKMKRVDLPPLNNGKKPAVNDAAEPQQSRQAASSNIHRSSVKLSELGVDRNSEKSKQSNLPSALTDDKPSASQTATSNPQSGKAAPKTAQHSTVLNEKSNKARANTVKTEWSLTSADIESCINEIQAASKISDEDRFADIDLVSFQTTLHQFQKYIVSLSTATSIEAVSLKELPRTEWAFTIFERGMSLDHCNVCFICEMIDSICYGIEECRENKADCGDVKLRCLMECMELVFGVNSEETGSDVADKDAFDTLVSISRTNDCAAKLLFRKESSALKQQASDSHPEQTLPAYLNEVSKIFEQYSRQNAQPVQSQLDSTRDTLAKTREGAMKLQKIALDLQDQLNNARLDADEAESRHTELEDAMGHQKHEYEKRLESLERVKEHYKRLLERKELELTEIKCTLGQEAKLPDTVHSMTNTLLPSDGRHVSFQKHSRPKSDDEAASRSTKRNRVSVEPDVSPSRRDSVIHESPPTTSPHQNNAIQRQRHLKPSNRHFNRQDSENDRNPLGSLTVNKALCNLTSNQYASKRDDPSEANERSLADKSKRTALMSKKYQSYYSSNRRQPPVKNPNAKKPSQESNESDQQYDFKYQEVVRGKEARAALPAHECEACRKFNDAIYAQTGADMPDRAQMVKECSRHRARFAPEFTPAGFWDMDFIDEK
jgi:hypothetical protein